MKLVGLPEKEKKNAKGKKNGKKGKNGSKNTRTYDPATEDSYNPEHTPVRPGSANPNQGMDHVVDPGFQGAMGIHMGGFSQFGDNSHGFDGQNHDGNGQNMNFHDGSYAGFDGNDGNYYAGNNIVNYNMSEGMHNGLDAHAPYSPPATPGSGGSRPISKNSNRPGSNQNVNRPGGTFGAPHPSSLIGRSTGGMVIGNELSSRNRPESASGGVRPRSHSPGHNRMVGGTGLKKISGPRNPGLAAGYSSSNTDFRGQRLTPSPGPGPGSSRQRNSTSREAGLGATSPYAPNASSFQVSPSGSSATARPRHDMNQYKSIMAPGIDSSSSSSSRPKRNFNPVRTIDSDEVPQGPPPPAWVQTPPQPLTQPSYKPTLGIGEPNLEIGESNVVPIHLEALNILVELHCIDVGGNFASQSDMELLTPYLNSASCVMFMYDVNNVESFWSMENWLRNAEATSESKQHNMQNLLSQSYHSGNLPEVKRTGNSYLGTTKYENNGSNALTAQKPESGWRLGKEKFGCVVGNKLDLMNQTLCKTSAPVGSQWKSRDFASQGEISRAVNNHGFQYFEMCALKDTYEIDVPKGHFFLESGIRDDIDSDDDEGSKNAGSKSNSKNTNNYGGYLKGEEYEPNANALRSIMPGDKDRHDFSSKRGGKGDYVPVKCSTLDPFVYLAAEYAKRYQSRELELDIMSVEVKKGYDLGSYEGTNVF